MSTAKPRVMVVDDDPNLLRMLRRGLVLAGYDVDAAEDVAPASKTTATRSS